MKLRLVRADFSARDSWPV